MNRAHTIAFLPESAGLAPMIAALQHCDHVLCSDTPANEGARLGRLTADDRFGLQNQVPQAVKVEVITLRDYDERRAALDKMLARAQELGARRPARDAIGQVCEELLMNALYDAPTDSAGRPLYTELDSKSRLKCLSPEPVTLSYAGWDQTFSVAVRDCFGRLDKATLLSYLTKCLSVHQIDPIERKPEGAGLGLFFVAQGASELIINVVPGRATEMICRFDLQNRSSLRTLSISRRDENG